MKVIVVCKENNFGENRVFKKDWYTLYGECKSLEEIVKASRSQPHNGVNLKRKGQATKENLIPGAKFRLEGRGK